jgi:hypothetical protein
MSAPEEGTALMDSPNDFRGRSWRTGLAALLVTSWLFLMMVLLPRGDEDNPFGHNFSADISSPVLALELSRTTDDVEKVLHRRGGPAAIVERAIAALRRNTQLDLVFIPLYVGYLILLARLFTASPPGIPVSRLRNWVTVAAVGAGVFDYVEDWFMFSTLGGAEPLEFEPSVIKWLLLAVTLLLLGCCTVRSGAPVYSFATRALLGSAHVVAGILMLIGIVFASLIGYSCLELGNTVLGVTVAVNVVGLLGPSVAQFFPGHDVAYVKDVCEKLRRGVATPPAVRAVRAPPADEPPSSTA